MDTVSVRELRGADLQQRTRAGKPLAVTNYRALIGVFLPVSRPLVQYLAARHWPQLDQSIEEGERAMAAAVAWSAYEATRGDGAAPDHVEGRDSGRPSRRSVPLAATVRGDTVIQTPESKDILDQLRAAFNPARSAEGPEDHSAGPSLVRIGDLSAARIEKAGAGGETLAVTHDHRLIGFVIPITQDLVQLLIEENISRVLDNIGHGEKQLKAPGLT